MMKQKLIGILNDIAAETKSLNISAFAASAAFFLFISFVPMLVLVCTMVTLTSLTESDLIGIVTRLSPDMFDALFAEIVSQVYDATAGAVTLSAVLLVWTASKGVLALVKGLDVVYRVDTRDEPNYFLIRLRCCGYMLILLVTVIFSLLVIVSGNKAVREVLTATGLHLTFLHAVVTQTRTLYLFVLLALVFGALYTFLPYRKQNFFAQLPGGILAALSWIVFSYFFSIYASRSAALTVYGSMTMLVILLLWLYFCMCLLLVGGYVNRRFAEVFSLLFEKRRQRREYRGERKAQKKLGPDAAKAPALEDGEGDRTGRIHLTEILERMEREATEE